VTADVGSTWPPEDRKEHDNTFIGKIRKVTIELKSPVTVRLDATKIEPF